MYIPIGTITNTHGLKGAVSVKTDSDFKETRYQKDKALYILFKGEYLKVTIKGFFEKGSLDILTFNEYDSIEQVERFKAQTLYVLDQDREPLDEDTYYYSDLIGLDVFSESSKKIGTIKGLRDMPQGALLVVEREGLKDALIPFRKEFVKTVAKDHIVIIEMEGLL
ncbi:MAG: ribosome maturation factor RimM [Candidatus Izemoplasmataceae bacterium]